MIPQALNTAQFAKYKETIEMLYQVDDDFRTLCDDYLTSKMGLEEFKEKSIEDRQRELEYKRLSRELEKEIVEYVTKRT
ncbi:hypothetical protein ACX0G7_16095 [Flavitalea antarctica]